MGAREKLNSIYQTIAAFVAGLLGLTTNSIFVFIICFGILAVALFHDGSNRGRRTVR